MNPRTWHSHVYTCSRVVRGALRAISMGITGDARFCIRKITLRVLLHILYFLASSASPRLALTYLPFYPPIFLFLVVVNGSFYL